MQTIEVRQALEKDRNGIAITFADAFIKDWEAVSKDNAKVAQAISNGLILKHYIVATLKDQVVGFVSLGNDKDRAFKIPIKDFQNHFGFFKGYMLAVALKNDFEKEIILEKNSAYIDILGVQECYQRKGIAGKLIEYVINNYDYNTFILNVSDVNENAINLYKKHGFQEYKREKISFAKQRGFTEYIYLKYSSHS